MHKTILLIDDEWRLAQALQTRLQASGFRVRVAASGKEGLSVARAHCPDVILLDINMPEMDGYKTCRAIRADPSLGATPIIVISATADAASCRATFEAGANQFLAKPYEVKYVLEAIQVALDSSGMDKDAQRKDAILRAMRI